MPFSQQCLGFLWSQSNCNHLQPLSPRLKTPCLKALILSNVNRSSNLLYCGQLIQVPCLGSHLGSTQRNVVDLPKVERRGFARIFKTEIRKDHLLLDDLTFAPLSEGLALQRI